MARAADIHLTIDDFQTVADRTPYLADLKPSGRYYMVDLHRAGGIPALLKHLIAYTDLIDGTQPTVTGRTLAENVADAAEVFLIGPDTTSAAAQDVVRPLTNPIKRTGHIGILRGNLAVARSRGLPAPRASGSRGRRGASMTRSRSTPRSRRAGSNRGWHLFLGTKAKVPPVCQRYSTLVCPVCGVY
jgi:hypothetical protein